MCSSPPPGRAARLCVRRGCDQGCTSPHWAPTLQANRNSIPACLAAADLVVVDRVSQCVRFGELSHAVEAGLLREDQVHAELGEVVAGKKSGRTGAGQITIRDLTGVGFQEYRNCRPRLGTSGRCGCMKRPRGHEACNQRRCMMNGTGTGIQTPVPWLRTTCPNP